MTSDVRSLAARVWRHRLLSELEAGRHFSDIASSLEASGASRPIVTLAEQAAADELKHADSCRQLVAHFGGAPLREAHVVERGPRRETLVGQSLLQEVVAVACVTETLSTALLGELVRVARDPVCRQVLRSILRDEVAHSRLGWAYLAEQQAHGAYASVSELLPRMLETSLGHDFWSTEPPRPEEAELAGLGQLERCRRQAVVRATLLEVVFPGLEHFGIDTALGKQWCVGAAPLAVPS